MRLSKQKQIDPQRICGLLEETLVAVAREQLQPSPAHAAETATWRRLLAHAGSDLELTDYWRARAERDAADRLVDDGRAGRCLGRCCRRKAVA